jgi:alpha-beta hydrolase superfamily lysophospholipase
MKLVMLQSAFREGILNSASQQENERFIESGDGLKLFFRRWPLPDSKACVALLHGFAEHSGRYDRLAEVLNQLGFSVCAFDYRGHGQSGGRRAHVESFDDYLLDVDAFLVAVHDEGFKQKPILLGHSQGGLIAIRYIQERPSAISGLILSSPFLGLAIKLPSIKLCLGKLCSLLMPTWSMPTGIDASWLSHDKQEVETYASDSLVSHHASARWFTEVLTAQRAALEWAPKMKLPTLILQAGQDRLAKVDSTRSFFNRLGSEDRQLKIYDDFFHEIFNEKERDKVFFDLQNWLESFKVS